MAARLSVGPSTRYVWVLERTYLALELESTESKGAALSRTPLPQRTRTSSDL